MQNGLAVVYDVEILEWFGHRVRTITVNGERLLVAADVAIIGGYRDATNMLRSLPGGTQKVSTLKSRYRITTSSGDQLMAVITREELMLLTVKSNREEFAKFQKWAAETLVKVADGKPTSLPTGEASPSQLANGDLDPLALMLAAAQQAMLNSQQLHALVAEAKKQRDISAAQQKALAAHTAEITAHEAGMATQDARLTLQAQEVATAKSDIIELHSAIKNNENVKAAVREILGQNDEYITDDVAHTELRRCCQRYVEQLHPVGVDGKWPRAYGKAIGNLMHVIKKRVGVKEWENLTRAHCQEISDWLSCCVGHDIFKQCSHFLQGKSLELRAN